VAVEGRTEAGDHAGLRCFFRELTKCKMIRCYW